MEKKIPHPEGLVMTQAEQVPPPEPTVPEPPLSPRKGSDGAPPGAGGADQDALLEVKRFAERIGGLHRLHKLVEELIRLKG